MTAPIALGAAALLLLAGCSLPQRHASVLELSDGAQVVAYPAELRAAYVTPPGIRVCSEPMPDVSLTSAQDLSGAIKMLSSTGQSIEGKAAVRLATTAAELSGRTQIVLLARDLLYRVCEMGPDQATAVLLFNRVADLVETLGKVDEKRAEADAALQRRLEANGASIDAILVTP